MANPPFTSEVGIGTWDREGGGRQSVVFTILIMTTTLLYINLGLVPMELVLNKSALPGELVIIPQSISGERRGEYSTIGKLGVERQGLQMASHTDWGGHSNWDSYRHWSHWVRPNKRENCPVYRINSGEGSHWSGH